MSEINVINNSQRIIVDAPTQTASVINAGPVGPAGPSTPMVIHWHSDASANFALTNSPQTERWALNLPVRMIKLVPLNGHTKVRLAGNLATASASVNSPLVRLLYLSGAFSTTIGSYANIGTTQVGLSLATAGYLDTGWIDLAAGAVDDVWVGLAESGGDGVLDPAFGHLSAFFR